MTDEMREVETESVETDKKVEETFAVLYQQPMSELKVLYQKEFSVALKGKDKQRIAMRLAKKIVAKGETYNAKGDEAKKDNGKSNGQSKAIAPVASAPPQKGSGGLTEKEASEILQRASAAFVKVDALKAEKREEVRGIKEKINESRDKMTEILRDDGDADVRVEKLEVTWSRFTKLEAKKEKIQKDYNEKIKDAGAALRDTLTNIRQQPLPFGGDDGDDK